MTVYGVGVIFCRRWTVVGGGFNQGATIPRSPISPIQSLDKRRPYAILDRRQVCKPINMENQPKAISQEEQAVRDADFKKRHLQFNKDLGELLKKYELVLEAEPFIFRGMMVARPTVSDAKKYNEDVPVSSPEPKADEQAVQDTEQKADQPGAGDTADGGK